MRQFRETVTVPELQDPATPFRTSVWWESSHMTYPQKKDNTAIPLAIDAQVSQGSRS